MWKRDDETPGKVCETKSDEKDTICEPEIALHIIIMP